MMCVGNLFCAHMIKKAREVIRGEIIMSDKYFISNKPYNNKLNACSRKENLHISSSTLVQSDFQAWAWEREVASSLPLLAGLQQKLPCHN